MPTTPTPIAQSEQMADAIARARREILDDFGKGVLPRDGSISSFADLHEYVDANCYGGVCDDVNPTFGEADDDARSDAVQILQDEIDEWLAGDLVVAEMDADEQMHPMVCEGCGKPVWGQKLYGVWSTFHYVAEDCEYASNPSERIHITTPVVIPAEAGIHYYQ